MPNLKNNIETISDDTETLVRDYVKLFSLRLTQRLSLFFAVIFSIFIFSILVLILIVFSSFVFAGYLNELLHRAYLGYVLVLGFYIICIVFLVRRLVVKGKPLLANMFVQFVAVAFDVDLKESQNLQGIKQEGEVLTQKIESGKDKIKTNFQLLRYMIFESLFTELFGLFTPKEKKASEKTKKANKEDTNAEGVPDE